MAGAVLALALVGACSDDTPTAPTRYGSPYLYISCDTSGRNPLTCQAEVRCSPEPCAPSSPGDVTQAATWTSADRSIVSVVAPGQFASVDTGDTVLRAVWRELQGQRTVSVFPGTPPLPTFEIFGSVHEAGSTAAQAPIDGAVIEVIEGRLTGRTVTSGVPPPLPPGYVGPLGGRGYYRILAAPPGTHRLRVSKPGYVTQDREVSVLIGSPGVDFPLQRDVVPATQRGQPADDRTGSAWVAAGAVCHGPVAVRVDAEPPLLLGLTGQGRLTQRVDVPCSRTTAIEAGLNWFPVRHAGLEVRVSRDGADVRTEGQRSHVTLTYMARLPPDFVPSEHLYDRTIEWPIVRTSTSVTAVSVNGAVRWVATRRVSGTLTAGPSRVRVAGEAAPIGFTTFVLGGRSVLFPNEYRLTTRLGPASAWRFTIGGSIDTRMAGHAELMVAARLLAGGDIALPLHVTGVESESGFSPPSNTELDRSLSRSEARVRPGTFQVLVGIKIPF